MENIIDYFGFKKYPFFKKCFKNKYSLLKVLFSCLMLLNLNNSIAQTNPMTITASVNLAPGYSHPGSTNYLSACYDHFELYLSGFTLLAGCSLSVSIPSGIKNITEFPMPGHLSWQSTTAGGIVTEMHIINNTATNVYMNSAGFRFDYNACSNLNNLTVDLEFPISLCGTHFTLIPNPLQPYLSVLVPSSNPPKQTLVLTVNRQVNKLLSIEDAIQYYNGTFSFLPSSYSSNINKYSLFNEIVDRYYIIYPESGISDYFTLNMEIEDDAEIISIEAIKSGGNFALYNDPNPIPSGADYTIVFRGVNASNTHLPLNFAPYPYSSSPEVKAHISDCVYSGNDDCLYNEPTARNFIIIHEQLRMTHVANCGITLNELTSKYNLSSDCDEDYTLTNNSDCSSTDLSLNLKCEQKTGGVTVFPKYFDGTNYQYLTNNLFTVCSSSGSTSNPPFSQTDLIIDVKNVNTTGAFAIGAGNIAIEKVGFRLNTNYFTYTSIQIGNILVPNSAITITTQPNAEYSDIQIDFNNAAFQAAFMANPNIGPDGLSNQLYANFPNTSEPYVFLPEGAEFGIRLTGFHFINCVLLDQCNHTHLSMTGYYNISYKTMCDYFKGTETVIPNEQGGFDYNNTFQGFSTSFADPLDVQPPGSVPVPVHLSFTYTETAAGGSTNPIPKEAFSIEQTHTTGISNIISCPNKEYFARVILNPLYTPQAAEIISSIDGSLIASNVNPTNISTGVYEYHWSGISPNYSINFDAILNCDGTIGLDEFICEMREKCDDNCTNCTITYACKSVFVNRHCPGVCPEDALVKSKNFNLQRTTKSWVDESDFDSNPLTPSVVIEDHKVYPCDQVKVISTLGSSGSHDPALNISTGITGLEKFYYQVSYPITELNSCSDNVFEFDPTANSFFTLSVNRYISGCPNVETFTIPITSSNVSFSTANIMGVSSHVIKFEINLSYSVSDCTTPGSNITVESLLETFSSNIDIEAYLKVKDFPETTVPLGYYDLNKNVGMFAYEHRDNSTDPLLYEQSCDWYLASYTYFKTNGRISINQIIGPGSTSSDLSLCKLGYWLQVNLEGGYPSGPDFPNEFRPVIAFPKHFNFSNTNGINFISGSYTDDHVSGCLNSYPIAYNNMNGDYEFGPSASGCNFHAGMTKSNFNVRTVWMEFQRSCANTATVTDEIIDFTDFNLRKFPASTCETNLMDAANSHIAYHSADDELTALKLIVTQLSSNINYNANSNPYTIPFGLTYKLSYSSLMQNGWVYFTGPSGTSFVLFDAQHIALPSHNIIVGANTISVFHLGDLTTNHLNNYQVEVAWTNCSPDPGGNGFAAIPFEMHYGAACAGYASLTAGNFPFDACYGNFMIPFTITPQQSHLALNGSNAIIVSGCSPIACTFSLNNTGADLTNTLLTLNPPSNFAIDFTNSQVSYISAGINHTVALTGPMPININNLLSTLHYNVDNFSKLDFVITLIPVNWHPTTTENIYISVSGISQCGLTIVADNTLNCTFINLPQLNIAGGNICDGQSINLFADLNPVSSSPTYLWSTGNTSSIYSTNTPGTYTVTVQDNGCIYEGSTNVISATSPVPDLPPTVTTCQSTPISITACSTCSNCIYLWSTGATSNTITTASLISNYTVTVTDIVTGCSATVSTIKNNESFPANISVAANSPNYICKTSIPLSYPILEIGSIFQAYGPYSYNWNGPLGFSSSAPSVYASNGGNYSVTLVSATGCTATSTYYVGDITPIVSFQTPVITSPSPGTPYVEALNVSPPPANYTSYAWSTGATTPTITVAPTVSTTYSVTVTNTLGGVVCSGTASGVINTGPASDDCTIYNNPLNVASYIGGGTIGNIGSGIPITGYDLNNDLVVNSGTLTLANCNIAIKAFAKIILNNNASLVIGDNVHLYSCGANMWNGITANPFTTVYMNTSKIILIEDAIYALHATGNGPNGQTPTITCTGNVIFNDNYNAIKLVNGDFSFANLNGARFTCTSVLKFPYGTGANLYSYNHIVAENAGTLNLQGLNGNNYSNLFVDATIAVKCRNTNLNIDNCSFELVNNTNTDATAVYAMTYASHARTTINIGTLFGSNSLIKKNRFSRYKQGVAVFANNDLAVFDNDFVDLNIGVRAENIYHGFVQILRNSFVRNTARSVDVMDCYGSRIDILNNKVNYLQPFNLLQESVKGIYVRNSSQSGGTTLKIRDNIIENCFFGIQVMNQAGGDIQGNIIYFHISDAELLTPIAKNFRKGICLQNSSYIYVTNNNQVERNNCGGCTNDPNLAGKIAGIYESMGKLNLIKDNTLTDLPSGIAVYGNCPGTQFECNSIVNSGNNLSVEGFRLNNAILDNQGYTDHPNGNKWVNWNSQNAHIFSTNPNQSPFEWYYDNAFNFPGVSETYPSISPSPILKVQTTGYTDCISVVGPCSPCDEARLAAALTAANNPNTALEDAYVYRQYVYSRLNDSLQLMYGGSVHDVDLQTFFTIYSLTASGQLGDINDLLQNNDRATAFIMNEVVNPAQLVEYNNQVVNRVSAMEYEDSIRLSPIQRAELIPIAYQLPELGGEAVYRARAILGIDFDDYLVANRNSTAVNIQSQFIIFPNPGNGQFTIRAIGQSLENTEIEICDNLGKVVYRKVNAEQANAINIDMRLQSIGIYALHIKRGTNNLYTTKIVKTK